MNPRIATIAAAIAVSSVWQAKAADWTVSSDTTLTENVSYDEVHVNDANLTIGAGGKITLTGKGLYLPGEADSEATLTIANGGNIVLSGSSSTLYVGEIKGKGHVVVTGNDAFNANKLVIGGSAVKDASGYYDFMRIQSRMRTDGDFSRVWVNQWQTYANGVARVIFDGSEAAIVATGTSSMFYPMANATFAFEGINGASVNFGVGQWYMNNNTTKKLLVGSNKFKTQGSCDVVFYNHQNGKLYAFELAASTNQFFWTHTGKTIVSNACMIKTTADYALPNGSQTGRMEFKGTSMGSLPTIDLCGTTQLVNGLFDATPGFNGTVTNSSVTAATLIVGADGGDCDLKIGRVGGDVSFGKVGAGAATVVATNLPAVTVSGGSFMVSGSNLSCGSLTQDGGAVGVVSGATFDLSGAAAGSDVLSHIAVTDGAGGGTFRGATLAASGVIDLSTATPTAEGFGEDTLAVSFADCANPENIQNWTVRVNGAGGNSLGAKISGGNLRIGKTATVIMMR
ncbi:MAG: hypothetical protein IKH04_04890 [Kiritimatiellae bacterium]|nr:hypothetical protein [Kiritimatiellia bacterium]